MKRIAPLMFALCLVTGCSQIVDSAPDEDAEVSEGALSGVTIKYVDFPYDFGWHISQLARFDIKAPSSLSREMRIREAVRYVWTKLHVTPAPVELPEYCQAQYGASTPQGCASAILKAGPSTNAFLAHLDARPHNALPENEDAKEMASAIRKALGPGLTEYDVKTTTTDPNDYPGSIRNVTLIFSKDAGRFIVVDWTSHLELPSIDDDSNEGDGVEGEGDDGE